MPRFPLPRPSAAPALLALCLLAPLAACASRGAAEVMVTPAQRHWPIRPAPIYSDWWGKTEACAGKRSRMTKVEFWAVADAGGWIRLGNQRALAWWVRDGNRIYLPASALLDEQLVRHEMLHAITRHAHHPHETFVERCHVASAKTWADSTLRVDPANPRGL